MIAVLALLALVVLASTVPAWHYLNRTEPTDGRTMTPARTATALYLFASSLVFALLVVAMF